jgi:uncharacterized hydrophobic protein (TIGR00271 family)
MKKVIKSFLDLYPEETEQETYEEIIEGVKLKGYNFWLLGFAMIIACIGLNTDSVSAVIGAMLISPLMGPILGFAFGLAIQDNRIKRIAVINWLYMTVICLTASSLFFILTPFDFNTLQLSAFKNATIFDILLALFGGLAGFIGVVKRDGTKVISGVAVATACMPPLCTAGYGIAHLDWTWFLGGLYFYLINCLFIGWATFLLARFTRLHLRMNRSTAALNKSQNWLWLGFIIIMTIPGVYLGYKKWYDESQKVKFKSDKERIIELEKKVSKLDSLILKSAH